MIHDMRLVQRNLPCFVSSVFLLIFMSCAPRNVKFYSADSPHANNSIFTPREFRRILKHASLPQVSDPTNRHLDSEPAAQLGHRLFFDSRLSVNNKINCATCHDPAKGLADGKPIAEGLGTGRRHTPSLWNVAYNRWFFWDGRADSLWAQALHPIESPAEMGSSRLAAAHLIYGDAELRRLYESTFGELPTLSDDMRFPAQGKPASSVDLNADDAAWKSMNADDQDAINRVFANIGKSLAAYESKLVSRRSPFDVFAEGLATDDKNKMAVLSPAAQRGLMLFVGSANCRVCHAGPNFTDGEFHDTRVPTLDGEQPTDPGRFNGVNEVIHDPFNATGVYSDEGTGSLVEFLINNPENWGRFKTPSLRNVARTAPYMHQGQFATLNEVIDYYSTLDKALPAGHHGETILQPLFLSDEEKHDLVAFLESLTDENIPPEWLVRATAATVP
ncbi:MAG: hypothetical protein IPK83_17260 [Planctomycetes bacterium]|nr:hypothetical protein [Planctomycetota bacterium]